MIMIMIIIMIMIDIREFPLWPMHAIIWQGPGGRSPKATELIMNGKSKIINRILLEIGQHTLYGSDWSMMSSILG